MSGHRWWKIPDSHSGDCRNIPEDEMHEMINERCRTAISFWTGA